MVQFARPDTDITDGTWTKSTGGNVNLFSTIDETPSDDADYDESIIAPASDVMAVGLSDVVDPLSSVNHIVRYRYGKDSASGAQIDITVQLRMGYISEGSQGTLIHSEAHVNVGAGFTAGTFTLSGAEADAITDYTDLQVRILANQV